MPYRMIPERRILRLLDMTEITNDGCWLWRGCKTPGGYGHSSLNGKATVAHRVAYQLIVGPIPEGMDLDHLCRNRACVNPAHLDPVTRRQNLVRGVKARGCVNGHQYSKSGWSFVKRASGRIERRCKICHRARNKAAKAKKAQEAKASRC